MELGQRLKAARLEMGLSQRQLCGDVITRNMLSQIENGSARPSMETLRYLSAALGKPMGYFLEEEAVTSPNRDVMTRARIAFEQEGPAQALRIIEDYKAPDDVFDWEAYLFSALARMQLAEKALQEQKPTYAEHLLLKAGEDGKRTPYYTKENERRRLCLLFAARPDQGGALGSQLPPDPERTLLLAAAAPDRAGLILDGDPQDDPRWYFMRAEAWYAEGNYAKAVSCYEKAPQTRKTLERLESCCKELEDYKTAYYYACKLREEK